VTTAAPTATPVPPAAPAASRKAFARALVTAGILAAGVLAVTGLERALHATFDKPPAPLRKNLDQLKKTLGAPPRYEASGADLVLDPDTVQTLGTKDYLLRQYRDRTVSPGAPGEFVNLNLNYYGSGDSSPHVPENCWAANGRAQDGASEIFDVPGVTRLDGSVVTLRVKLVSFRPQAVDVKLAGGDTAPGGEPLYNNVAYVFHVNGEYVATTREVTSRFWKAENKYAYHAKIEVTPMARLAGVGPRGEPIDRPLLATRARAKEITADFLRASLADIEACLPDPAILTGPAAPPEPPSEVK
jgi:hypothetical protein